MSMLQVDAVKDAGGLNNLMSLHDINRGRAKNWWNLNGTGTITLRDGLNISSIVDAGVGDYQINFVIPFVAAEYAALPVGSSAAMFINSQAAGSVTSRSLNTSMVATDTSIACGGAWGDFV